MFIQVSGSLYGALAGSLIAYPTSDFLGEFLSLSFVPTSSGMKFFCCLRILYDNCIGVGRRRELIVASALYAVGGLITGFAPDLVGLIIGRFIYGTGIGLVGGKKLG